MDSWTLANGLVERSLHYAPERGLYTAALVHTRTGRDLVRPALAADRIGGEFSFAAAGRLLMGAVVQPGTDVAVPVDAARHCRLRAVVGGEWSAVIPGGTLRAGYRVPVTVVEVR